MTAAQRRTKALLAGFAGNRDEWPMLKGVLCMAHDLKGADHNLAAGLFDRLMIAERMDELNAESIARQKARAAAPPG